MYIQNFTCVPIYGKMCAPGGPIRFLLLPLLTLPAPQQQTIDTHWSWPPTRWAAGQRWASTSPRTGRQAGAAVAHGASGWPLWDANTRWRCESERRRASSPRRPQTASGELRGGTSFRFSNFSIIKGAELAARTVANNERVSKSGRSQKKKRGEKRAFRI